MQMSPMIDIVFLPFQYSLFETPSATCADKFGSVATGIDAGVSATRDESLAVRVEERAVEFFGTEGVAFLCNETFVVSVIGFVGASENDTRSDVAAYEPSSVATGGFGSIASKWFDLDF